MIVFDKISIGVDANSYEVSKLYYFIKHDIDFHVFGDDINKINNCVKYIIQKKYNRKVFVHYNGILLKNVIDFYNRNGIILIIDDNQILKNMVYMMTYIPYIKNLIINYCYNITKHELYSLLYYYKEYNKYCCGVYISPQTILEHGENIISDFNDDKIGKDILYSFIFKFDYITKFKCIIPYNDLYFSLKDNLLYYLNKEYSIECLNDFQTFYTDLTSKIKYDRCDSCIATNFCEKYNIYNCDVIKKFYTPIIEKLIRISKENSVYDFF